MAKTNLIIYQSPLFQKGMNAHYRANIACEISPAGCDSKIFGGVQTVGVDHEIAIVLVYQWRLGSISIVEKLG